MEYRYLGKSGFKVPVLSLGTATFGGSNEFFGRWGQTDVKEASRLVDISMEYGANFFDTADVYSGGDSESILGEALKGRRQNAILSTKGHYATGSGPNEQGSSRHHLINACEASLKRLKTDYLDIYFLHGFDAFTPVEETLGALDNLIRSGKIRYIGCSNFSSWHVMKSLATAEKYGLARYVAYQGYYSVAGRDYEHELMPLAQDQGLGLMVWSPLAWGRLTGKIRRGQPLPEGRIKQGGAVNGPVIDDEYLYRVIDALEEIAGETGKTVPQVAINWLLSRPTVSNVIIGARNEEQLLANLGATGWQLGKEQIARLDAASVKPPVYPYWHIQAFPDRNPSLV